MRFYLVTRSLSSRDDLTVLSTLRSWKGWEGKFLLHSEDLLYFRHQSLALAFRWLQMWQWKLYQKQCVFVGTHEGKSGWNSSQTAARKILTERVEERKWSNARAPSRQQLSLTLLVISWKSSCHHQHAAQPWALRVNGINLCVTTCWNFAEKPSSWLTTSIAPCRTSPYSQPDGCPEGSSKSSVVWKRPAGIRNSEGDRAVGFLLCRVIAKTGLEWG